jgi:hypothetical protein
MRLLGDSHRSVCWTTRAIVLVLALALPPACLLSTSSLAPLMIATVASAGYYSSSNSCPSGYVSSGDACQPLCSYGCGYGTCSQPEICTCNAGWKGSTCSECLLPYLSSLLSRPLCSFLLYLLCQRPVHWPQPMHLQRWVESAVLQYS